MARRVIKYLVIGLGTIFTLIVGLVAFSYFFPPTYEADARLPGSNSSIAVQLQPMHPYLAEYRRAVVLRKPGASDLRKDMFPDTGGYSRTQLYRLSNGRFVIQGFFDAFVIDPQAHSISAADAKLVETAKYLGAFDDSRDGHWRFIPESEDQMQRLGITK
ncbi:MAG: hypothetical protein GEU77_01245 [Deltaproteobacteria bacterium]|nr:hypothetical protein [Deltaproteobacteria bacterium]